MYQDKSQQNISATTVLKAAKQITNLSCPDENAELFRKQYKYVVRIEWLCSTRNLDKYMQPIKHIVSLT